MVFQRYKVYVKQYKNCGILIGNVVMIDNDTFVYLNIVRLKNNIQFSFFPFLFLSCPCAANVYACSHVCIHACVYMCAYVYRCLKLTTGVFLHRSPLYVLLWGLWVNPELPTSTSACLREFFFMPPGGWIYNHQDFFAFMWVWVSKRLSSCLHNESFIK